VNPLTSAPERLFAEFFFGAAMTAIAAYLTFFLYLLISQSLSRICGRRQILRDLERTSDNYLSLRDRRRP
jgi:hypothetical protein